MRKLILLFVIVAFRLCAYSQTEIKLSEISNHLGDSISVTGTIMEGRYLSASQGSPTFLNIAAKYPNHLLTLVIWGEDRSKFSSDPESVYLNKSVKVVGKVGTYNGKPQIILYSENQITILPSEVEQRQ